MIRKCTDNDVPVMFRIINDAAMAYKGVIPKDRWREPYMPMDELRHEINHGVEFWGYELDGSLIGVMGIQDKGDIDLIRHAYVLTPYQKQGIGTKLLRHLEEITSKPILIGTWADASWAIRLYQKNGYRILSRLEIDRLLTTYWSIPQRQVETSIVMASSKYNSANHVDAGDA